jgi:2-C-methyl-D-erythritol 4-phosphate cytidylyltransferase
MKNIAVILAGGTGTRAGEGEPKQFRLLPDGRTVLETCVTAFAGLVDSICVVTHPDFAERTRNILNGRNIVVINGGKERWESSWNAIQALGDEEANVLIHDCARPFVSSRIIADVCRALETHEAVTVAIPATDTLYMVNDCCVADIPPREKFMRAQTPQAFRLPLIRRAYELAMCDPNGVAATDDCGIVKRYLPEREIFIVEGEEANKKLTYKEDFQ